MRTVNVPVEFSVFLGDTGVILYVGDDELPTEIFSLYDLVDDFIEYEPSKEQTEILINDLENSLARLKSVL
jgi:hypothetical protein